MFRHGDGHRPGRRSGYICHHGDKSFLALKMEYGTHIILQAHSGTLHVEAMTAPACEAQLSPCVSVWHIFSRFPAGCPFSSTSCGYALRRKQSWAFASLCSSQSVSHARRPRSINQARASLSSPIHTSLTLAGSLASHCNCCKEIRARQENVRITDL